MGGPVQNRHFVAATWIMCAAVVLLAVGCRSFRQKSQNPVAISAARQFTLRGTDALQQHKLSDAEALFAESLKHCPNYERAHSGMAEVLYRRGDCELAAQHMTEAAKLSGNNPDLLVRLGEMQLERGQIDQALAQADLALASDWQHPRAWQLRGRVLDGRGQMAEAVEAYNRSLMAQPNNPPVQIALASIYQRQGRPQRALATLERMSDLQNPEYDKAGTWLLKGAALASLGQADDARLCLREASLRATANETDTHLELARLQADLGELAAARVSLGKVLSQNPQDQLALQVQKQLESKFEVLQAAGPSTALANTGKLGVLPASIPLRSLQPGQVEDSGDASGGSKAGP